MNVLRPRAQAAACEPLIVRARSDWQAVAADEGLTPG